jgi:hypothetical protein
LCTIRQQRWLTREVAVENGVVVRTTTTDDHSQPEQISA